MGGRLNGTITGRARMFRTVSFSAFTGRLLFPRPRPVAGPIDLLPTRSSRATPSGPWTRTRGVLPDLLVRELDDHLYRICLCVNSTIISTGSACA